MKKIALIGVTMLTAISLAACSPSSNSGSKNSGEKSTTESSNKPTLEIPVSVVADGSKTAAITGKTTPNTKVQIGYGIIGDKVTSDKEGNFTLKYEIDEANPPIFTVEGKDIFIDSLYSFNYGNTHFMCVNSELTSNAETGVYGLSSGTQLYDYISGWWLKLIY